MFIQFLVSLILARKGKYVIRPSNSKDHMLILHSNSSIRVTDEQVTLENWPRMVVEVGILENGLNFMRIGTEYFCKPKTGNILTAEDVFDNKKCSWKIEENKDGTSSIKIGNLYLSGTDEPDNRRSSKGYFLRLIPSKQSRNNKWEFKKAKNLGSLNDKDSDSEEDNKIMKKDNNPKLLKNMYKMKSPVNAKLFGGLRTPLKYDTKKNKY